MKSKLVSYLILLITLSVLTGESMAQSITMTGDYSPNYDGTSNPWHVGGNGIADLNIGFTGSGGMVIDGSSGVASVYNLNSFIGKAPNGTGSATVSGEHASWTSSGSMAVGLSGVGSLDVLSGGHVEVDIAVFAGRNQGSSGQIEVAGTGSLLRSDRLYIGDSASGNVQIHSAGKIETGYAYIGVRHFGVGSLSVDGTGSTWDIENNLGVGIGGQGTLVIENGGMVTNQIASVGQSASAPGTATVTGVGSIWNNFGLYIGGSVHSSGGTGSLNIENGGLVNTLGTTKIWGGGSINLNGGSLHTRDLDLTELSATTDFNFSGGLLHAETILGSLQQDGGTLAPGDSPGLTTIDGNYVMNSGFIEIEIGGTNRESEFDAIDVTGIAQLDGTIDVNLIDGFSASLGDSFQLIDATGGIVGTPVFDFSGASLTNGLWWDTNSFLNSGSISVAAVPEPAAAIALLLAGVGLLMRRNRC